MSDDRPLQGLGSDEIVYAAGGLCTMLAIHTDITAKVDAEGGNLYEAARELITGMAYEIEALRVELSQNLSRLYQLNEHCDSVESYNRRLQNQLESCEAKLKRLNTLTYLQSLDTDF